MSPKRQASGSEPKRATRSRASGPDQPRASEREKRQQRKRKERINHENYEIDEGKGTDDKLEEAEPGRPAWLGENASLPTTRPAPTRPATDPGGRGHKTDIWGEKI
ncbi:hypothetical protein C8R44DRAFT_749790 [Mycena epipterygia]|nr:hypothetical protein C8R44DRAFT_749790 [Mycena epipterygia]